MDKGLAEHEDRPSLFVLSGMAGVGKSAAAAQWAHANQEKFAGGVLYADLDNHRNQRGVGISDVVAMFLRALGVIDSYVPATVIERIALFRSRTADRPVLVVLDGVDEPAQVRSVVPSANGSVVVATTRRRLAGLTIDGAEFIELTPLDIEDSAQLMTGMIAPSRIEADRGAFGQLVGLCEGLPLALRVAGAGLTHHRRWPVSRFVQHLSDDRERLSRLAFEGAGGSVAKTFDTAYEDLPDDARQIYLQLGLHPGPHFSVALAAAAAGIAEPDAESMLESLCAANLLEEIEEDRFRFHQLLALHAHSRAERDLSTAATDEVRRRMVDHYASGAAAADVAVLGGRWRLAEPDLSRWPVRFDSATAMAWFTAERPNLLAAMRVSADRGWHEVVWRLCDSLWAFFHSAKHYADWIDAHRLGVVAAQLSGNPLAEIHLRNRLVRAHIEMRDLALAAEQLDEAAALPSDERAAAVLMESRGLLYREQHRYSEAVDVFRALVTRQRATGDHRAFVLQSYQLGDVLVRSKNAAQAVPVLNDALREMPKLRNEQLVEARVRIALGTAYSHLRQYKEARRELQFAVDVTHACRQHAKEAQALEELVELAQAVSDGPLFTSAAERLVRLYEAAGNPRSALVRGWLQQGRRTDDG
ncbi:NB-ARC domain-containing protein [Lentzea sp. NPDC006480]|uniref:NB-ARC domain-containing protein n=1 Tax=Lentzea sp. NPDC006480 TaxID=3157176 RepID=UPI0033AB7B21